MNVKETELDCVKWTNRARDMILHEKRGKPSVIPLYFHRCQHMMKLHKSWRFHQKSKKTRRRRRIEPESELEFGIIRRFERRKVKIYGQEKTIRTYFTRRSLWYWGFLWRKIFDETTYLRWKKRHHTINSLFLLPLFLAKKNVNICRFYPSLFLQIFGAVTNWERNSTTQNSATGRCIL
jgi:hypothetical protein